MPKWGDHMMPCHSACSLDIVLRDRGIRWRNSSSSRITLVIFSWKRMERNQVQSGQSTSEYEIYLLKISLRTGISYHNTAYLFTKILRGAMFWRF